MDKNILSSLVGKSRVPWESVTMVSFGIFEGDGIQLEKVNRPTDADFESQGL